LVRDDLLLRLNRAEDAEILILRHHIAVLQRASRNLDALLVSQ